MRHSHDAELVAERKHLDLELQGSRCVPPRDVGQFAVRKHTIPLVPARALAGVARSYLCASRLCRVQRALAFVQRWRLLKGQVKQHGLDAQIR